MSQSQINNPPGTPINELTDIMVDVVDNDPYVTTGEHGSHHATVNYLKRMTRVVLVVFVTSLAATAVDLLQSRQ